MILSAPGIAHSRALIPVLPAYCLSNYRLASVVLSLATILAGIIIATFTCGWAAHAVSHANLFSVESFTTIVLCLAIADALWWNCSTLICITLKWALIAISKASSWSKNELARVVLTDATYLTGGAVLERARSGATVFLLCTFTRTQDWQALIVLGGTIVKALLTLCKAWS